MDKLQWFKFNYADWRMGKIQRCSEITQARFLNLCCLYWSKEANLSYEDAEIEIDKEHLEELLSKKIIERDDEHIFIKFLDEQLLSIAETSKGKSKAAKIRWEKYRKEKANEEQNNADVMHVHKDAMQNDAEKSREEKSREEREKKPLTQNDLTSNEKFLSWFNKCRTLYLEIPSNVNRLTQTDKSNLHKLKESYSKEDFNTALHNICNDKWANETNNIMPKHFLNEDNFAKYLNMEKKPLIPKSKKVRLGWKI